MTNLSVIFLIFGALLTCILSITSKNPVISVIFLILTFLQSAIFLILKGITFIGLSYIVIYVGAIAVLFLFVVMMINIRLTDILETENQYTKNLPLAIIIGYLFLFLITEILEFNLFSDLLVSHFHPEECFHFIYLTYNKSMSYFFSISSDYFIDLLINVNNLNSDLKIIDLLQLEILGYNLYTYYAVLLIILGFILLLGMFAAIIITRNDDKQDYIIN
uniref:NADH-ubiquinone oxidoreductase chain 6 n=1 Tax=Flammulina velutipes TaxID=38945 RepID=M9MU62_FLAVE|nr:NADH dehydrogenase subunit 6 [Flammulina velutipes]AEF33912.1 NADH dehydrogenase subunit 6 [Flammulina velutipes]AEO19641.1 NADH dehydrogenase subunit 6 [Flammulina velutipes]AEO19673.1 NADH dehydrogenase subunit 6 [Flammulina velutipes]AEO19704.1 NADH dehydrogenase subunit 6 [Flammulina velutipes]